MAARWHRFALPRNANGLRQPVHVEDLATAAFATLDAPETHGRTYPLPGGETLAYSEMVARVLAPLQPPAKLHMLPPAAFRSEEHPSGLQSLMRNSYAVCCLQQKRDSITHCQCYLLPCMASSFTDIIRM